MTSSLPVVGFVGWSGSGKTTLLEQVVGRLTDAGARLATVKHAKPGFDLDQNPSKDSWRLRSAGASQVLIASRDRWALMAQQHDPLLKSFLLIAAADALWAAQQAKAESAEGTSVVEEKTTILR